MSTGTFDSQLQTGQKKKVLVIGSSGFVASHLIPKLIDMGWIVHGLDIRPMPVTIVHKFFLGDVRQKESVLQAMKGCNLVINLAAEHRDDVVPITLYDEVNVLGARIVCEVAELLGVGRQIFTSSVAVYGEHLSPMGEDTRHDFFNDYGRTKHLAELEYLHWQKRTNCKLVIVRPTVIFGPGNRGNVYNLLKQLKYGPFVMIGDGLNRKSMAAVENVADFLSFLSEGSFDLEIVNYADKPDFSMNELVQFVNQSLKKPAFIIRIPLFLGLMIGYTADLAALILSRKLPISGIRVRKFTMQSEIATDWLRQVNFQPKINLREALSTMVSEHV
jgi:nucleoside-diphosphate-sugar epimerase